VLLLLEVVLLNDEVADDGLVFEADEVLVLLQVLVFGDGSLDVVLLLV